jgi:hypothetical protein
MLHSPDAAAKSVQTPAGLHMTTACQWYERCKSSRAPQQKNMQRHPSPECDVCNTLAAAATAVLAPAAATGVNSIPSCLVTWQLIHGVTTSDLLCGVERRASTD